MTSDKQISRSPDIVPPVIVALDFDKGSMALDLLNNLDPGLCRVKIGKELFTREGPTLVTRIVDMGFDVFLDLKFHDIPTTTAKAVAAAADLGVWMVNVHASGGSKMMEAAGSQLVAMGSSTLLIAVTVLTSMGPEDLAQVGIIESPANHVLKLARLAGNCGLDGVVCSAHEAGAIATAMPAGFLRVTPGIRPANSLQNDQVRITTPREALNMGSTHLVVGRPITASVDPYQSLLEIIGEVGND